MAKLARISISLDDELLERFDGLIAEEGYPTRSEAVKGLIRERLVRKEWATGAEVAGAVVVVYDHHRQSLVAKLMDIQHDSGGAIISTQHIHLDHDNCLEVIVVRGEAAVIRRLFTMVKSVKGIKHSELVMTTTGSALA